MAKLNGAFYGGLLLGLTLGFVAAVLLLPRLARGQELDRVVTACVTGPSPSAAHPLWAWRLVDGRKCWYAGAKWREKSLLYWQAPAPKAPSTEPEIERIVEPPPPADDSGEPFPFPRHRWWPAVEVAK